ncbi:MAG: hypothetical protein NTZ32_07005 [Planctomycetales bacterium]|nr:hypothetical protein [Planctomycetales bacterium]
MNSDDQQIVPGLSVSTSGQATVDPSIADALFDLAIKLEEATTLPVDVQHGTLWQLLCSRLAVESLTQQNRSRPTTLCWQQCWPLS